MITWGIVANSHDASIAAFENEKLIWAGLAKQFSNIPNDPHLNVKMLDHLNHMPDKVIWYEYPRLKTWRQLLAGQGWRWQENNIPRYLRQYNIDCSIEYTKHHLSHAAYGYYTAPGDNYAIVVFDSIGEFECFTIWEGKNNKLKKIFSQSYPHSIGLWYSAMTQRIGLKANAEEYKVVELAKKGDGKRYKRKILNDFFFECKMPSIEFKINCHRGVDDWFPDADINDLAAATQEIFEDIVMNVSYFLKYKYNKICFIGGCALNNKAIDNVRTSNLFDTVYVPPNPGDPGSCVGAVLAKTKNKIDHMTLPWFK